MNTENGSRSLGEYIKARRLSRGLLLVEAASDSGLHYSYWSKLESGQVKTPSPKHLQSIARTLQIDTEDLYGLAGYDFPDRLPTFTPYLRAKYQLPPEAVADLERYFNLLRAYFDIPEDRPVFPPESEEPEQPSADDDQKRRAA